jgi:hypothetical protein
VGGTQLGEIEMNALIEFYQHASFMEGFALGLLAFLVVMIIIVMIPHKDVGPW